MAGSVASIYLIRGAVRRGVVFRDAGLAIFGSEDLFDTVRIGGRARRPANPRWPPSPPT